MLRCVQMDKDGNGTIGFEEFESVLAGQANLSRGETRLLRSSVLTRVSCDVL